MYEAGLTVSKNTINPYVSSYSLRDSVEPRLQSFGLLESQLKHRNKHYFRSYSSLSCRFFNIQADKWSDPGL